MKENQRTRIGRYESWVEDGSLRLQCHEFGHASGFAASMDATETQKLLDLLMQHQSAIEDAAHKNEAIHAHHVRSTHHSLMH